MVKEHWLKALLKGMGLVRIFEALHELVIHPGQRLKLIFEALWYWFVAQFMTWS